MVDSFGGIMQLPIRRRGQFLKDDFFKGFQNDFESAIQDIMDRHSARSLLADQFSNYRKLRENSQESGPVASISDTKQSTVIVLDMSDFLKGSMSVRTRGYYVIVEADYNTKTFHRKFPLHRCTNIEGLKSAMSNEGILTITAPKQVFATSSKTSTNGQGQDGACLKVDIGEPEDETDEPSAATASSEEIETSSTVVDEKQSAASPSTPPGEDRVLSISKKGKFFEDHYFENVWKDFEKAMDEMVNREESEKRAAREQKSKDEKEMVNRLKNEILLEAEKKQREFFDKAHHAESQSSLRIPKFTRLNSYRNLRSWAPDTETQAATITQDANGYKIVMDVKNCSNGEGDLSIKATEGSLTVSGRRGSLSFKKEFTLKGLSNPDQVNASLSEDGVLIITVNAS